MGNTTLGSDVGLTRDAKTLADLLPGRVFEWPNAKTTIITGLTSDSRRVQDGFVFVALMGSQADGTAFIEDAVSKGAAFVLTDQEIATDIDVRVIKVVNARQTLARMAARFYDQQPRMIAAVTGTAGKTSVAAFLRQIWKSAGFSSASIGTVGVVSDVETVYGSLTTPDPVELHDTIDRLARAGVTHLALEASSHGLDQHRLDGVHIGIGAFTNLGRDHMDYHPTVEDYFDAKMHLVDDLLRERAPMVVDLDSPYGDEAAERADIAGCEPLSVGERGDGIRLIALSQEGFGQRLSLDFGDQQNDVLLPLVGRFQVSNALVAAGMALASGVKPDDICRALENLKGEAGRLEYMGSNEAGAMVFIDYAHKVEALENVLDALRPYANNKLTVVFGCGGDRDHGKRALMGAVAKKMADATIVTDDNPRSEDPATVRQMILDAVPSALEIGDREKAISHAVSEAQAGDVVVIAGKGHETGQIVGDKVLPFSDHEVVNRVLSAS